jgi:hypothetical protein
LLHNNKDEIPEYEYTKDKDMFFEVEMPVDETFDGDLADIKEGKFVSFRYLFAGLGPPKNPRISLIRKDWMELD